jgi:hypothetical protein
MTICNYLQRKLYIFLNLFMHFESIAEVRIKIGLNSSSCGDSNDIEIGVVGR